MQTIAPENYLPQSAVINKVIVENSQIKTFELAFTHPPTQQAFQYRPGQFMMVSVPHCGEAPISFSSSPTRPGAISLSVRKAGQLTSTMHALQAGDRVGLRGPYGTPFDMASFRGRDLLFVAGGIGLAPLRSVITSCLDNRADYGRIFILYGSRLPSDIAFHADISEWRQDAAITCLLTVDRAEPGWDGPVGLVTALLDQVEIDPARCTGIVCGPPMMIGATLNELSRRGLADDHLITTMERHMKCGVGICRHCHLDGKLVCTDGPVFTRAQLKKMEVAELR
ncbi:MAG: FAD/NAD(P)-binding protein [Desulfobulbaceae bacterium]|nr:FAD/NAD(P)-binding protein [Desulfobulbaceae bacterium]